MPLYSSTNAPDATPRLPTVDDALALARIGWPILPCAPRTKQPARDLTDWQDLATVDPETIRAWWQTYPEANVGSVIGHRRLVLDIDVNAAKQKDGRVWWHRMLAEHGAVPPTWHVWSGSQEGGFHLYFAVPDTFQVPHHTDLAPDVEALGCAHLVILPPSIHEDTGLAYRWDETGNPFTLVHPANAPDWLLNEIRWATATRRDVDNRGRRPNTAKPSDESLCLGGSNKVPEALPPPLGTLLEAQAPSEHPKQGHGAHLVALACDPTHLPALLDACGLDPTLQVGYSTRCPIHDDEHPSATVLGPTPEHPSFGLYCHAAACKKYYALVDIYYHRTSAKLLSLHTEIDGRGRVRDHAALRMQWTTRLLEAAKVLPVRCELGAPSLPDDAPPEAKAVFDAILHVRHVRAETREKDAALPLSLRFLQDWLGQLRAWTFHYVNQGKRWLISRGYLVAAGTDDKGERLWRLGRIGMRRARKGAPLFSTEAAAVADVETTVERPPVEPTPACPEAHEFSHDARHCVVCIQARLLERRAQAGIWVDPSDPYGRRSLGRSPT